VGELRQARHEGRAGVEVSPRYRAVLDAIAGGQFSADDRDRYGDLVAGLHVHDPYMLGADFDAYWAAQRAVDRLWAEPGEWWRKSILNTARMGWFSSDRTIREYAKEIWRVPEA
jgi:starch phosphorylase